MSDLAQYFTREQYSTLLTSSINFDNPGIILDLGIGNGSLTTAAQKKWKNAAYLGVDLDNEKVNHLVKTLSNVSLYNLNSLDAELSEKINIKVGTVDIAICNPPYLNLKKNEEFAKLLKSVNLNNSINLRSYTTDLLFFAQNLSMLKIGGVLGIILPAGLITGHDFKDFRKDLLENHCIENIIELEAKIFSKTEAKTFIVILKKGIASPSKVLLSKANKEGAIFQQVLVEKTLLYQRMDFIFHFNKQETSSSAVPLKFVITGVKRGNISNLDLRKLSIPYFHTTDFKKQGKIGKFDQNNYVELAKAPVIANAGDILVGRVGKTCHKQVMLVTKGKIAISDCIYRITVPKKHRKKTFDFLTSEQGIEQIKLIKHGVCAQVISKTDLENLPIEIDNF